MLNDLSFLTVLSLISFTVPGFASLLQGAMLNFIYMDILKTNMWLSPIFFSSTGPDGDDHPLNS
jgi:hypothetical protein